MVRKTLFIGLTGMLVVVLGYLIFQGRKNEKMLQQEVRRPVEVVKDSKPTLTRVFAPFDLEIVESKTKLSGEAIRTAKHTLVIQNKGNNTYEGVLVKFSYFGSGDKVLESQTRKVSEVFQPGQAREAGEIVVDNLPKETKRSTARILSADLEPATSNLPASNEPSRPSAHQKTP